MSDMAEALSPVRAAARRKSGKDSVNALAELLERQGIDVEDIGKIAKVNTWQGYYKNAEGEAEKVDMVGLSFAPSWDSGPEWPVVQPAKPVIVRVPKGKPVAKLVGYETAFILPDPQIGFLRDLEDPSIMTPFHDAHAIDVAFQVMADVQPDRVVNLGDTLDFAELSRFKQERGFVMTVQPTIDAGHTFLATQRAICPDATIDLIEGNHDARLPNLILQNAAASFGIRKANTPGSWPVMSVPNLLRLDELDVAYHSGYPAARIWINERLCCMHGHRVKSGGSTAALVVGHEKVSTIFGHIHRRERQDATVWAQDGPRTRMAMTPGCLCRVDGVVPGVKGGIDIFGKPVESYENWQQGFAVVTYKPGDGEFETEMVGIHDGVCIYRGKRYESRLK